MCGKACRRMLGVVRRERFCGVGVCCVVPWVGSESVEEAKRGRRSEPCMRAGGNVRAREREDTAMR